MSRFLKYVRAESFGGLANRQLGPLEPGLNVVIGPNEAGKSTFAALTRGILFGWEDAHGVRNTYRPPEGQRIGSLVFGSPSGEVFVARNEEGVSGEVSVLADIDLPTYDTAFSFTAAELTSLRGSSDVTARLLTAESGTASSPAVAFVEIEQRIAACTARGEGAPDSIFNLEAELEEKRDQVKVASQKNDLYLQEHHELSELRESREAATKRIEEANAELEDLLAWRAELEHVDKAASKCELELERLHDDLANLRQSAQGNSAVDGSPRVLDERLLQIDSTQDRVLRDQLDEFADECEKLDRIVDTAKENSATSTAAYEALMELDEENLSARGSIRARSPQALVSVLLPIAFIVAGLPLFVHGRQIQSLSFTALGVGLIVFSVLLAIAAFVGLFSRPGASEVLEGRKKDAQWVMLQDSKKLEACQADKRSFEARLQSMLESAGLADANGSIRQARILLDEARDQRAALAATSQRTTSLELRARTAEEELLDLKDHRLRIAREAGLPDAVQLRDFDAVVRDKTAQRDALLEAREDMSERFGELTQELELAKRSRELDRLKLEYFQVRARLRERKHELVKLLLARRMLDRSINEWESRSQPEVYAWAGRLLSVITEGQWVAVATSGTGSLVAVDSDGEQRDPRHLSLGTCQQLYLALRIAILITAEDVGRSIPVFADDVLVHFDSKRRLGAARALATLAEYRQVVVFTCHAETCAALRQASPEANVVTLAG